MFKLKLLFAAVALAALNVFPAQAADTDKDPLGLGTLQKALDEQKRTGTISPETRAELARVQERGQEASAILDRQKLGREECHAGTRLSINEKYKEADPLFRKSLALREKAYGANDPLLMEPLIGLGECYTKQGWRNEGAQLFLRAASIGEAAAARAPRNDFLQRNEAQLIELHLGSALSKLARTYEDQGKLANAESVYKRLRALESKYPSMKQTSFSSYSYARLLRKMHRDGEAMEIEAQK